VNVCFITTVTLPLFVHSVRRTERVKRTKLTGNIELESTSRCNSFFSHFNIYITLIIFFRINTTRSFVICSHLKHNYGEQISEHGINGQKMTNDRNLACKPAGKRKLGGPSRKWENNIKIDFKGTGQEDGAGFNWLRIGTNGGLL
jgi:hypothetical protein